MTLASRFQHGGGTYEACYHARTGAVMSERAAGAPFGSLSLHDRVLAILLSY